MLCVTGCGVSDTQNARLLKEIASLSDFSADAENSPEACVVDTGSNHPYDVCFDYGDTYDSYADRCDWSLVFDADYYKKTFPMLALLYDNDDELLLEHFQTVGIHEGRQGKESFNVGAYMSNCSDEVRRAFRDDKAAASDNAWIVNADDYECYYFYYMLDNENQRHVNSVTLDDEKSGKPPTQYKQVLTYVQKKELENINACRKKAGAEPLDADSELCTLADYRAYVNQTEGLNTHEWAEDNEPLLRELLDVTGVNTYGENMIQTTAKKAIEGCDMYMNSDAHKRTLLDKKYRYVGLSNTYTGERKNNEGCCTYSFDVFGDR